MLFRQLNTFCLKECKTAVDGCVIDEIFSSTVKAVTVLFLSCLRHISLLVMTILKATEQCFPVAGFMVLYIVIQTKNDPRSDVRNY